MVSQEVQVAAAQHASSNGAPLRKCWWFHPNWVELQQCWRQFCPQWVWCDRARLILSGDMGDESMSYLVSDNGVILPTLSIFSMHELIFRMFDFANIPRWTVRSPRLFYAGYVTDPRESHNTLNYSVSALTFGQGRGQGVELSRHFGDFHVSGFTTTVLMTPVV